jgi:hypothetical protein
MGAVAGPQANTAPATPTRLLLIQPVTVADDTVRVWLVERTYSDDEQNLIILTYETPDWIHYARKERALTSFADNRPTTASVDAEP